MKRLALVIVLELCLQLGFCNQVQAADSVQVKELNFVFLHGAGAHTGGLQLLADSIVAQAETYILDYEAANPGTEVRVDTLQRFYPNDVDIETWAGNIADSINRHFRDKDNLILIGHSMGGKSALYAVAKNVGGLADKVAMVVTINSPIKRMDKYYVAGGGSALQFCRARWLLSDQGICNSLSYYDSSQDGGWVGRNKYWLAFISGEAAPLSKQFDVSGVDGLPRNMDDIIIPISAQYADGADIVYYGEYSHTDFSTVDKVADSMSEQILQYIFGGNIECSVLSRRGTFEREANWLPVTARWEDIVGELPVMGGRISHFNESFIRWQEWEDIVGSYYIADGRSSYHVERVNRFSFIGMVKEANWLNADSPGDAQLYLRTRAAPRSRVEVDWSIYRQGLMPPESSRDRYEVEIVTGTPLTSITRVSWVTDNPYDARLRIYSEAQGPYRWFKAEWRIYTKESRQRQVIDEISGQAVAVFTPVD
ncbi:MAG: hypothetical protein PHN78_01410 [Dehalococcoidales bacterium]|nr:hypothetical protein [Dehalococcoidales bacterium]